MLIFKIVMFRKYDMKIKPEAMENELKDRLLGHSAVYYLDQIIISGGKFNEKDKELKVNIYNIVNNTWMHLN